MHCPACGFENASGIKFCGECGAPLKLKCSCKETYRCSGTTKKGDLCDYSVALEARSHISESSKSMELIRTPGKMLLKLGMVRSAR